MSEPLEIRLLRTRPLIVQAVQVTEDNRTDVALWCEGIPMSGGVGIYDEVTRRMEHARVGDWIVQDPFGRYRPLRDDLIFGLHEGVVSPLMAE